MSVGTSGPWRWLGNHSLVGDHGRRPAVLTARDLKQRGPDGLLVPFDPESPDGRLMAAAPDLLAELETAVRIIEEAKPGSFDNGNAAYGTDEGDVLTGRWLAAAKQLIRKTRGE